MKKHFVVITAMAMIASCVETGQQQVEFPLFVAGSTVAEPIIAVGDVPIVLDRADLAFGPLYLCAGASAGELCDTARAEWLGSVVVDTLDPSPVQAGQMSGVSGTVRSWMYDLGISSQLTRDDPYVLEAARQLDGFSLILEGKATVDQVELPFRAELAIQQNSETELGVPVIRKSASENFFHDITGDEEGLTVRFDPVPWVSNVDFRYLLSSGTCAEQSAGFVCDGLLEKRCDEDGVAETRDCSDSGQVCGTQSGCTDSLEIQTETEAYRMIRSRLTSGARPVFVWQNAP